MVSIAANMPKMGRVTIEYESGLTTIYEGAALEEWAGTYYEALSTLIQVRTLQQYQSTQEAQAPETPAPPSNVRSLRDVIKRD